jgi:hypothetical protein
MQNANSNPLPVPIARHATFAALGPNTVAALCDYVAVASCNESAHNALITSSPGDIDDRIAEERSNAVVNVEELSGSSGCYAPDAIVRIAFASLLRRHTHIEAGHITQPSSLHVELF